MVMFYCVSMETADHNGHVKTTHTFQTYNNEVMYKTKWEKDKLA